MGFKKRAFAKLKSWKQSLDYLRKGKVETRDRRRLELLNVRAEKYQGFKSNIVPVNQLLDALERIEEEADSAHPDFSKIEKDIAFVGAQKKSLEKSRSELRKFMVGYRRREKRRGAETPNLSAGENYLEITELSLRFINETMKEANRVFGKQS